ncbi:MAG: ShlB/FhaC/HecB family hemolysin secretion/activation protein [Pseudomonas sp.]|uniref:ShlB/FhaC/HecB family hemolysin secretion/activation protein n=1 Tax=Pseudomonas abieticivorans TaxID=2931382 RepID=UPI0020BEBA17|nr:ShlB/FhaC/HecB family hemolysin secretion/activation protein [Pseudomonas sp. PIA16]MDE1167173.1 ShlB/FhaC/HecB family hemolysin secretion/activation protein [Pseudomonas sp.]
MPRFNLARLLLCGVLLPPLALAEPPAPLDETLRLLEQERRQREARERQERLRQLQRQQPVTKPALPAPVTEPNEPCWPVPGVSLSGNQLLEDVALSQALKPGLRACMGATAVRGVLAALTQAYVTKGYIAARAYLRTSPQPNQPLQVLIDEGFVESIELGEGEPALSLAHAFPGMIGRPLHLPQLEQGLDQLNRLRSVNLTAQILPGSLEGGSRVVLRSLSHASPLFASLGYKNAAPAATGRVVVLAGVGLDNPFGLNDQITLAFVQTVGNAPNYSHAVNLGYRVPYGPWTLTTSFTHGEQFIATGRLNTRYLSENSSAQLDRTLWRNQQAIVSAGLRLDHKSTRRHIGHINLFEPDPRLSVLQASLDLLWLGKTSLAAQLSYAQGVGWLGANPRPTSHSRPQPRFEQYRAYLTHNWVGGAWRWESALELQYSPDLLPGTEQLQLANATTVRGFRDNPLSASSGAIWRNELSIQQPLTANLTLTPHVAVDYGRGWLSLYGTTSTPTLAAASSGATLAWPAGKLKLDYQKGLSLKHAPGAEPGFWNMELSLYF